MKKGTLREIKLEIPEEVFLASRMDEEQVVTEVKKLIALRLFADGRLSGGMAAKLAGMNRVRFLLEASDQGIEWLPYSDDEVRRELQ